MRILLNRYRSWSGTEMFSPTGKAGIIEDRLSLEVPQLHQMSSLSTSGFARTTTIDWPAASSALPLARQVLLLLLSPLLTATDRDKGHAKLSSPPNAKNAGSWRLFPFFNGHKSHRGHQRPCPVLLVTSGQLSALCSCYHVLFCCGAANRFSWTWIFWVNFQSLWFPGPADHMAGQTLLAVRRRRTETDTTLPWD